LGKRCVFFNPFNSNCVFNVENRVIPKTSTEHNFKTKDGKDILISKSVEYLRNLDGEVIGGSESFSDITEKKAVEKALEESRIFAEAVADSTPAMIYIYNLEKQKNIWANMAYQDFFGHIDDIEYKTIADYLHPEDLKKHLKKTSNSHY